MKIQHQNSRSLGVQRYRLWFRPVWSFLRPRRARQKKNQNKLNNGTENHFLLLEARRDLFTLKEFSDAVDDPGRLIDYFLGQRR